MAEGDQYQIGNGCGCKLCKTPFVIPKITDDERALRQRARDDYRKAAWALTEELNVRNAPKNTR